MHDHPHASQESSDPDPNLTAYRELVRRQGLPLDYIDRLMASLRGAHESTAIPFRPIVSAPNQP